jgi:hypothetical protein
MRADRHDPNQAEPEMLRTLEEMLDCDEDITARAVARKHPSIAYASSITRGVPRSELLLKYQSLQTDRRSWSDRLKKSSSSKTCGDPKGVSSGDDSGRRGAGWHGDVAEVLRNPP